EFSFDGRARVARARGRKPRAHRCSQARGGRAHAGASRGRLDEGVRGPDVSGDRGRLTDSFEHREEPTLHGAQAVAHEARKVRVGGYPEMNEKRNANGAGEARGCERAEQLVAYLYGESSPVEDADFRRHLAACAVCGEELASLEGVRDGLGVWREEV